MNRRHIVEPFVHRDLPHTMKNQLTLARILFGQSYYDPKNLLRVLFRLTNVWMGYNLLLILLSNVPHRPIPWLSWVNVSLYFLVFLLSFFIWQQEKYNRDIFFLFTLSYLAVASSFLLIFVGKGAIIGNQRLAIVAYIEAVSTMAFLLTLALVFLSLKYSLPRLKTPQLLAISIGLVAAIFLLLFGSDLKPTHIFYASLPRYYRHLFDFNLVTLAAVFLYFVNLVRSDRTMGEYITSLVVVYLFRSILDGVSLAGAVFGFRLFEVDQYFLTLTMMMLAVVLFRKLCFCLSPFGQYYEDMLHGYGGLKRIRVTRRGDALSFSLLEFLRDYLRRRVHVVGIATLLLVGAVQSLPLSLFVRLNLIAVLMLTVSLYIFFYLLYRKRARSGFVLPHSRRVHEH